MRVRERIEMKMKVKSGFQEQASSVVYASVLYDNSLIFGVNGGVLIMSDEGKATDRKRDGWMDKLRRLRRFKSGIEDRGIALSKRDGFGDWLRDIRRARGRI